MTTDTLAAVRAIAPDVAAHAEESEQLRTLSPTTVELMKPTGAFRMYVPDDLDGPGVTAWESLQVIEELAYNDTAAGWCSMIGSTTSLNSSFLPEPFATELFGHADALAGGFAMPAGRAIPVEGGLRVTGRWQWGSGTRHSAWVGGGCLVVDETGKPTPRADGLAVPFVFAPVDDVEFVDNWHVSGLSGTGSGDYTMTDVFIPEGRWVQIGRDPARRENPWAHFSFYGLLAAGIASCGVGAARRSIDELVDLAASKKPQGSTRTLSERTPVQADIAIAEAKLLSSWAFLRDAVSEVWDLAVDGNDPSVEQKRLIRLASTHAAQTAAEITELMYKAGGGAAVYQQSPLQRTFRDSFVATQHAMVAPRLFELCGRLRLGLDTETATL